MQPFALDSLMSWLHETPKVASEPGPRPRAGLEADDFVRAFRLPPLPKNTKLTAKEFAVYLLHAGAEIEHSLLVQYLYAAYSINERRGNKESNLALKWKTDIRLVAREEMAHLVTVQNLLLTLGAGIYLNRGSLHKADSALPLPFKLERLSLQSVSKYVLFESPSTSQMDVETRKLIKKIRRQLGKGSRISSVGSIYAALYWLFMKSDEPDSDWPFSRTVVSKFVRKYHEGFHLKDEDFVSGAEYLEQAASPEEWGIFENDAHVDGGSPREAALASLRWIMAQGEGPSAIEKSHFFRFLCIYKELKHLGAKSESMRMQVPTNPHVPLAKRGKSGHQVGTAISNRRSKLWGELVNARYQLMIMNIFCSLSASRTRTEEKRRRFAQWALAEMEFVKKIGQMLPLMSLANSKKKRAGAVFQAVLLPASESARHEFRGQLLDLSDRCVSLLQSKKAKLRKNTKDGPTAALAPGLLDSIARQNDEMRDMLRLLF
jgi:hypothetical protein